MTEGTEVCWDESGVSAGAGASPNRDRRVLYVAEMVSRDLDVPISKIFSSTRASMFASIARACVAVLLREEYDMSVFEAGEALGRDPSAISHMAASVRRQPHLFSFFERWREEIRFDKLRSLRKQ